MPFGPGTRLGRYEIAAPLGTGGMGEVYRAHDPQLRRDVAIKVIAARFATDPDLLKRFSGAIEESTRSAPERRARWRWLAAAIGLVVLVVGLAAWRLAARRAPAITEVRVHRLTDTRGLEEFPAISPDGKSITFVTQTGGKAQIYVRLVAGGAPLQVTRDAADHLYPRWSPDSASIGPPF